MIELPEAMTISRQMNSVLLGKRITDCICGTTPHRFAWFNRPVDEFAAILRDCTVGSVSAEGNFIFAGMEPGWTMILGDMGGRILFHLPGASLPTKHQLLLRFTDDSALTITIQMWGAIRLVKQAELSNEHPLALHKIPPLSKDFSFTYFKSLIADSAETIPNRSIKYFIISKPGIFGVGNGCLQDILYNARIHPKRLVRDLTFQQQRDLYDAMRETLSQMVEGGGRNSDNDLYNKPGGYPCLLGSHAVGKPCLECDTPIEKSAYLGGAVYFCPNCQR
jgi:formamidopyrimidine-DNA glycosylase